MNNAEFVNLYVEKQKKLIDEFQSKIILLETNLHYKDLAIEEANANLAAATAKLEATLLEAQEKHENHTASLMNEIKKLQITQHELNVTNDLLMSKLEEREQEADFFRQESIRIKTELNKLKEELDGLEKPVKKPTRRIL